MGTGKHGHAKAHIVALDIFTGKKYEDLCPTSHNLEVPFVKRTEYQLLTADSDSGEVILLLESGETKDDLNLPTFVKQTVNVFRAWLGPVFDFVNTFAGEHGASAVTNNYYSCVRRGSSILGLRLLRPHLMS